MVWYPEGARLITDQSPAADSTEAEIDGRQDTAVSGSYSRYEREIGKEAAAWAAAAVQVRPFAIGVWILIVGLLSAALWRRMKGMSERGSGEVKADST